MPTYDYRCESCGHKFEIFHSMKAAPERKCPKCKKMSLKRLIGGGAGVIFKGTGFYQTDYKSKGSGSDAKKSSEGGSEKSAGAKDSKSPDKK